MSNGDAANHWRAIEEEKLRKRIKELERKLTPRLWTQAEHDAWHGALIDAAPDVHEAFRALLGGGG